MKVEPVLEQPEALYRGPQRRTFYPSLVEISFAAQSRN
ncbi:hypothetical protein FP2506_16799 [Fulvimarina pelagi HTCC2506]|uniref:Uncharacterized protein n=1 Tax=Fulvimarina pelagi HTCC2506 TaxID=314231 RepID=Q0G2S0_9HYPH|nr:hypothetical protein FP2506_16799 [Fulvimarina pelagi HTCC2506]